MSWIKKFLFVLVGMSVALIIGISVLELVFGGWLKNKSDPWKAADYLNIIRDTNVTYDVENIYGKELPKVFYSRDKYGLRGSCADPREITVLTVGGSTTDQRYIPDGKTYQDVLQLALRNNLGNTLCFSNAGVDGHSSFGHLASFKDWYSLIPNLKPKFFLFYVGINDAGFRLSPNAGFDIYRRDGESSLRTLLREKSAIYGLLRTIRNIFTGAGETNAYAGHQVRPPDLKDYIAKSVSREDLAVIISKNTNAFAERLRLILAEVKKYNASPICVSQPHLFVKNLNGRPMGTLNIFQFEGKSYNGLDYDASIKALNGVMKELCVESGGYFIDAAAKSFNQSDFYDPVHMTPSGANRLGGYLFEEFERQGIAESLR